MDTYFNIDTKKCQRCYKCINICIEKNKDMFGYLVPDIIGYPEFCRDVVMCLHCKGNCSEECSNGAISIERW